MHAKTQESVRAGRFRRAALVLGVAGATVGGMVLGTGVAQAAIGNNPGAVNLNPTSGATSSKPTWATTVGCNSGFQGSAVFREVHSDGTSTNTISPVVNGTAGAFHGTLQAPISAIKAAGGIANGHSQELVVICFSGPSLTGSSSPEMDIYIHYSSNGTTYTTSTTP